MMAKQLAFLVNGPEDGIHSLVVDVRNGFVQGGLGRGAALDVRGHLEVGLQVGEGSVGACFPSRSKYSGM